MSAPAPATATLKVPGLNEPVRDRDPVLPSEADVLRVRWTAEMLAGLDWRKVVDVLRALADAAGCERGGTRIWPDGMAEFTVTQRRGADAETIMARLAPWNRWMASGECIERFAGTLVVQKRMRGVYVSPGGVSASAKLEAAQLGIEVLDADGLATILNGLPAGHHEWFYDLVFAGQPLVPSCPVCLRPLSQISEDMVDGREGPKSKHPDRTYHSSDIVAEPVVARRIEILRHCEVRFLREVRAQDVLVQGVVAGDFVCEGSLVLAPGAMLIGNVAARSVLVEPGASLRGRTHILKDNPGSMEKPSGAWAWMCRSVTTRPGCEKVRLFPH